MNVHTFAVMLMVSASPRRNDMNVEEKVSFYILVAALVMWMMAFASVAHA